MPRFYFHLTKGQEFESDPDGLEFADLEAAYLEAFRAATEIWTEMLGHQQNPLELAFHIHDEAGCLLLSQLTEQERHERVSEIVEQLNRGIEQVPEEMRWLLVELNLRAGRRAKSSTAYASACTYLAAGMALLDEEGWRRRYELTFALSLERAECEYLSGNFDRADALIAQLLPAGHRQVVVLGLPVVLRDSPLAADRTLILEPVQRLVERGIIDIEGAAGEFAQPVGDEVAVHRLPSERLEHQDVQGAVEEVAGRGLPGHVRWDSRAEEIVAVDHRPVPLNR